MTGDFGPLLSRGQVIELLRELGADLASRGMEARLFVVGGAAMALAFNTRRLTHDVDGVFEPKAVVYEAARRVAAKHEGLPENWLNDAVKGLLPGPDAGARVILDQPGIAVSVLSPRYLLALKVQAARIDRDEDDILFLARACGALTADEVLSIAEEVLGRQRLLPKSQFIVQEIFPERGNAPFDGEPRDGGTRAAPSVRQGPLHRHHRPNPRSHPDARGAQDRDGGASSAPDTRDITVDVGETPTVRTLGPVSTGEVLRAARHHAGMSISALARSASTSRSAIYSYESGEREPSVATAVRLLQHCGATLTVVLGQPSG